MSVAEMTNGLQFRGQVMAFASSLSGKTYCERSNKIIKTFQKPKKKFKFIKANNLCTIKAFILVNLLL